MKAKTLMNKIIIVGGLSACLLLGGCGAGQAADATSAESTVAAQESTVTPTEITETAETVSTEIAQDKAQLPDGVYTAEFSTDSSMFHVSEACDGKGTLTVKDGVMTIHISLGSKKILNLYPGLAEDAAKDGAVLLEPTTDTVTYSDGMTEEVYGFDVPVPVIGEEFDLALIGTKGKWYDHKVKVSDPVAEGAADILRRDPDAMPARRAKARTALQSPWLKSLLDTMRHEHCYSPYYLPCRWNSLRLLWMLSEAARTQSPLFGKLDWAGYYLLGRRLRRD